ncbi:hypothetical protein BKA70DRAFT_1314168 [Coprinopsis sp. MPI-PUGE-AT-0042]|nr:hypothetical protein BKA70DRAFT_1314168 [Coprinopsis sp. MPI-PUGE-AT-0042]
MPSSRLLDATALARNERLTFSFQFASMAIVYYDWILTLSDEITYVWRSRWRISTLFYIFCRYALVANVLYSLSIMKEPRLLKVGSNTADSSKYCPISCDTGYVISGILSLLGHAGIIAVWGLRTYAICDKNKYVAGVLGLSGSVTLVLLIVRTPFSRCKGPVHLHGIRGAISASMIFFDVTAFLLATHRAWVTMRENRKTQIKIKSSANDIILSQGNAIFPPVWLGFTRLMNGFKLPLSGLLTARFLLRLRRWQEEEKNDEACLSLPRFAVSGSGEASGSASLPQFGGLHSTGSILDELGGDIGPRQSSLDSVELDRDTESVDDVVGSYASTELDVPMRSSSIIRKGKRRSDSPPAIDRSCGSEVQSASARRATFVDPEGPSSAGPSYLRGRARPPGSRISR